MISDLVARLKVLGLSIRKLAKTVTATIQNSLNAVRFRDNRQPAPITHQHDEYIKKADVVSRTYKLDGVDSFALRNHSHVNYVSKAKLYTSNGIHFVEADNTNYLNELPSFVFARSVHQHIEYLPKVYVTSEIINASKVQYLEIESRRLRPEVFFALREHEHAEYLLKGEHTVASSIVNEDTNTQPSTFALKGHVHIEHDLNSQFKLKTKGLSNASLNARTLKIIVNSIPTGNDFRTNIQLRPRSVIKSDIAAAKIGASKVVPKYIARNYIVTVTTIKQFILSGWSVYKIYQDLLYRDNADLYEKYNILGKQFTIDTIFVFMDSDQFSNAQKYLKRRVIPLDNSDVTVTVNNVRFYQDILQFQMATQETLDSSIINAGAYVKRCYIPSVHEELQQLIQLKYIGNKLIDFLNIAILTVAVPLITIGKWLIDTLGWIWILGWTPFKDMGNFFIDMAIGTIFPLLLERKFMAMFIGSSNDKVMKVRVKWDTISVPVDDEVNALAGEWIVAKNMGLVVNGYEVTDNQQLISDSTKIIGGVIGERQTDATNFSIKAQAYTNLKDTYVYYSIWKETARFSKTWVKGYTYSGTPQSVYLMRMIRPLQGHQIVNQVTISQGKVTLQTAGLPSVLVLN